MDMHMQHGHRHVPWTLDKEHGHGYGYWNKTWASSMQMDTKHGHGHAAWTGTRTIDLEMDKHPGCRNADEKFSLASFVFS
jgi:hypothetical protein